MTGSYGLRLADPCRCASTRARGGRAVVFGRVISNRASSLTPCQEQLCSIDEFSHCNGVHHVATPLSFISFDSCRRGIHGVRSHN